MFSTSDVKTIVERTTGATAVACAPYKGHFLVRVEHASPDEKNYDPFYWVDSVSGRVEEFSVITDGDPVEIGEAFALAEK